MSFPIIQPECKSRQRIFLKLVCLCILVSAHTSSSFSLPTSTFISISMSKGYQRNVHGGRNIMPPLQAESNPEMNRVSTWSDDIITLAMHMTFCTTFAVALTLYEGYDCSYLKPQSATIRNYPAYEQSSALKMPEISYNPYPYDQSQSQSQSQRLNNPSISILQLMNKSTRGMGRGSIDRSDGWYQDTYLTSTDTVQQGTYTERNVPSYNEIMLQHRTNTVPLWKQQETKITSQHVYDAVESIVQALEVLRQLKLDAVEYEWDHMMHLLRDDPVLTTNLQSGCSTLQRATEYLSFEVRQEVGFDWGSCAWRHCGAQADAQESLAELYNSIGLFEPFECLFTLDIVERSLRDILTVMPEQWKPPDCYDRVGEYVPYEATNVNGDGGGEVDEDGLDSSEREFLSALAAVKKLSMDGEE